MLLSVVFAVMTTVVSEQTLTISEEDMALLQQLDFLETLDILKSREMDQELDRVVPETPTEQKK